MIITKKSPFTGTVNSMDLPVSIEEIHRFNSGEHVQNVWPHLNASQREFILSGITPAEWDETFGVQEPEN